MWVTCKDCAAARKGLELLQALMSTGVLEEGPAHSKVGRAIASLTSVRVACSNPAFQAVPCVYNPYGLHAKGHRYTHRRKHMHTYVLSLSLTHTEAGVGWGGSAAGSSSICAGMGKPGGEYRLLRGGNLVRAGTVGILVAAVHLEHWAEKTMPLEGRWGTCLATGEVKGRPL